MFKRLLLLLSVGLSCSFAQTVGFTNPSLEGPPVSSACPPSWTSCGGSPDTQPGFWSVALPAQHLSTYMGLVYWLSIPTSQESAGQMLTAPLVAGTNYTVVMGLVNFAGVNGSWNGSARVSLYGGNSMCATTQTLWTSGFFTNNTWQDYTATFTPTGNWTHFMMRLETGSGTWPGIGIDNLRSNAVLPVRLMDFKAFSLGDAHKIQWNVKEENTIREYVLEKSLDSYNYTEIGNYPTSHAKENTYTHFDRNPSEGAQYYRLRMVDKDGSVMYSAIEEVFYQKGAAELSNIVVYPNPASIAVNIELSSALDQNLTYRWVDLYGRMIKEGNTSVKAGKNTLSLTTENLSDGMYQLVLQGNTKATVQKVLVQH